MIKPRGNGKAGMTVSEAGRKGGERVRDERGVGFYQEIGRKGGELGGRKGEEAVRGKYGPSFYEEVGREGRAEGPQADRARQEAPVARRLTEGTDGGRREGSSFQPPEARKWRKKRRV